MLPKPNNLIGWVLDLALGLGLTLVMVSGFWVCGTNYLL